VYLNFEYTVLSLQPYVEVEDGVPYISKSPTHWLLKEVFRNTTCH